jgi:hypothetical protein
VKQKVNILRWFLAVTVIAALAFFGVRYPKQGEIPSFPSPLDIEVLGVTHFSGMEVSGSETDELVVNQTSTGDVVEFRDNGTVVFRVADGGTVTVDPDLIVDDTLNIDETAYALTGTKTITPTATYYQLAPTAALTLTLSTASAGAGDLLILHSTVATNTIIVDTGATVGGGNITLSTNDLALFIYGNSKWIEIASPDNS